jgi:ferredoxin, 2Fe-2S
VRIEIPQLKMLIELDEAERIASQNDNLLTILVSHGVPIAQSCGGDGVCGTCSIEIVGEGIPEESAYEKKLKRLQKVPPQQRISCLIKVPKSSKTWVLHCNYW